MALLLFVAILILAGGITLVVLSTRKKKPLGAKIQPQNDELEQARREALSRRLACARWLGPPSATVK
jgi:preprotein translocase subunit SecG